MQQLIYSPCRGFASAVPPFIKTAFLLALMAGVLFAVPAAAQGGAVSAKEVEALKALYAATGGTGWIRKDNWLSNKPVGDWYGVTVRGGQVVALDLPANNLTGALPAAFQHLTGLQELRLPNNRLTELTGLPSALNHLNCTGNRLAALPELPELLVLECAGNQLTALPELPPTLRSLACDSNRLAALPELPERLSLFSSSHNHLGELPALPGLLEQLAVAHNRLTFEDLEPVVAQLSPFSYALSPQDSLGTAETLTAFAGDSITLSADFAGGLPGNRYRWCRNGKAVTEALASPFFTLRQLTPADSGAYTCEVTNSFVTDASGLSLHRRPVTVQVRHRATLQPAPTLTAPVPTGPAAAKATDTTRLQVYPNPARNADQVRLLNTRTDRVAVSVFDSRGRLVSERPAHPAGQPVALAAHLPEGVYLLRVSDGNTTQVLRLVKRD